MAMLYMQYRNRISFRCYLEKIGFVDPSLDVVGMDDPAMFRASPTGPQLIDIPARPVIGEVRVKVLLVDFEDRVGALPPQHYEDLLFSQVKYPTGSMRDFYKEVSLGKVDITGSVHGWLRMPEPYSFYTAGDSGLTWNKYPHNAPRLAEDAVRAALEAGVTFEPELDRFEQGIVTALFIVHAGRGAEVMPRPLSKHEIWSHKWNLNRPVRVGTNLHATIYLVVPFDCKVGVCAHELGHLAFQWQDFYDPNYAEDGSEWDGAGSWDLMAGGSYNGNGAKPAHPAALHKIQHGWVPASVVRESCTLTLPPYTAETGQVYKLRSPAYGPKQYVLLENRKRAGFDFGLPGEGLLVWRVDEDGAMETSGKAGLFLVQADGRNDLNEPGDWNSGDEGDPFPGSGLHDELGDEAGPTTTSFADRRSGIRLSKIRRDVVTGEITLRVTFAASSAAKAKRKKAATKSKSASKTKPKLKTRRKVAHRR
jgi:immune inhibitor A